MSTLSENLRYLRIQNNYTQERVAEKLIIARPRWQRYEEGKSEPPLGLMQKISKLFHVSIDLLLSVDLRKVPLDELLELEDNRILLPIAVDPNGDNVIEVIPHKARAGYLTGYSDPEFIESLQHISLPFLRNGKFRAFPVEGDSMPPHKEGSFVIGKYVERLGDVMDGRTYILLTRSEGIVYKRLNKNGKNELMLHSDNSFYPPYKIKVSDVLEIWEYACSIATKEAEPVSEPNVVQMFMELKSELNTLKSNMGQTHG